MDTFESHLFTVKILPEDLLVLGIKDPADFIRRHGADIEAAITGPAMQDELYFWMCEDAEKEENKCL